MRWSLSEAIWYALGVLLLAVAAVSALGEWVFHWWQDPGQWTTAGVLLLSLLSFAWGASAREMRAFRRESGVVGAAMVARQGEMLAKQDQMLAKQDQLIAGQAEQTALLREVVASFRAR